MKNASLLKASLLAFSVCATLAPFNKATALELTCLFCYDADDGTLLVLLCYKQCDDSARERAGRRLHGAES
jgi:hypothetical protein